MGEAHETRSEDPQVAELSESFAEIPAKYDLKNEDAVPQNAPRKPTFRLLRFVLTNASAEAPSSSNSSAVSSFGL